jgi:hypothetical protein
VRYRGQRYREYPPSVPELLAPPVAQPRPVRVEVVVVSPGGGEIDPFDCDECPEDPRPHLHCPWGGMHKHYADEQRPERDDD